MEMDWSKMIKQMDKKPFNFYVEKSSLSYYIDSCFIHISFLVQKL